MSFQWQGKLENTGTQIGNINTYYESTTTTTTGTVTSVNEKIELETRAVEFIVNNKTIFEELSKL